MAMTTEPPRAQQGSAGDSLLRSLAIVVGSALLGLAAGLIWAQLSPQVTYVVVTHGSADVINPETSGFFAADATYAIIGVAGGLIIGLASYLLAVRRHGPGPMAAVLLGSIAAGIAARWTGEQQGLAAFNHQLLHSPLGTHLQAPLVLAGDTAANTWPTLASLPALAFWPLSACVAAGGWLLIVVLREQRSAQNKYPVVYPPLPSSGWLPTSSRDDQSGR